MKKLIKNPHFGGSINRHFLKLKNLYFMKNLFEIQGFYGASHNEALIFVYEKSNGSKWYCVENSCNVNLTHDEIEEGCDIEPLQDIDTMTSAKPLNTLEEFYDFIIN